MQIEFAGAADIDAMADLLYELFTLESDFKPERAKQLAALRWILDHPAHGRLFVARDAGRVVGMASALVSISTAEGMHRVTLLADKGNAAALAFYQRLGFEASAMVVRRLRVLKPDMATP